LNGGPATTMGTFDLTPPNLIDVVFSYGPNGFAGTKENGTYTVTPTSLSVVVTVEAAGNGVISLGPYSKVSNNNQFEGVWSGFTTNGRDGYCLTLGEFHANLWRGYQTRCDASYNFNYGTFLGTFNQLSANSVNLTYNFVDTHNGLGPDLTGQTLNFGVSFAVSSSGADVMTLTGQGNTTVQLTKVVTMPTQTNLEIHLQGSVGSFISDNFVSALAGVLNIDPRNIRIADIRSGSIIVTVEISDDAHSGVSSTIAPAALGAQSSLGGFPVLGVTNITPGNSATHMAVSWLVLLALILMAM